jgi:PAS domain S-box-containing protein
MRDITEMKKAQDKIDHLNKVLSAIINIDKIIMRGRNIKKSMQQICDALVKTRGYTSVFVVLYDQNQKIEDYFQTNLGGDNFKNFISYLNGKQVPLCAKKALEEGGIHIIDSRNQEEFCSGCPLVDNCPRENILIARLEYENVIYGLLSVSLYEFHQEQSDIDLFRDFITDISFALHYSNIAQERKVFQKKLLASEREYRELVEGANSIILKMDRDGKVIFFNKFAQNFFGYSQQEIIGRNVLGTIIPEVESFSQRDLRGLIKDIIQRPQDYKYHENENVLRNGRRVWVAWSNQVLYDDNKEAVEILSFGRDITEEKKIKEKLKESMKLKSKFISAVSHELRTPMTAIKEGIDIVFDGSAGDINPEQKEFLSLAKRNVDRLSRLVNDVLDFQKLESGRMDFDFQQNNINKLIEEVYKVMQPLARDKKIDFSTDCQQGLPVLKFDWDRIMQVVINLVNNSLKFTDKGYIKISSRHRGNTIIVSVADSGIGIKQEDRDKLFKTFSQIASGGMRKTGGTGLGLAISKEIIYRHRGKIWVESEYGNGSTFSFLLPIKEKRGLR